MLWFKMAAGYITIGFQAQYFISSVKHRLSRAAKRYDVSFTPKSRQTFTARTGKNFSLVCLQM
jgi:hypothetical protein